MFKQKKSFFFVLYFYLSLKNVANPRNFQLTGTWYQKSLESKRKFPFRHFFGQRKEFPPKKTHEQHASFGTSYYEKKPTSLNGRLACTKKNPLVECRWMQWIYSHDFIRNSINHPSKKRSKKFVHSTLAGNFRYISSLMTSMEIQTATDVMPRSIIQRLELGVFGIHKNRIPVATCCL